MMIDTEEDSTAHRHTDGWMDEQQAVRHGNCDHNVHQQACHLSASASCCCRSLSLALRGICLLDNAPLLPVVNCDSIACTAYFAGQMQSARLSCSLIMHSPLMFGVGSHEYNHQTC